MSEVHVVLGTGPIGLATIELLAAAGATVEAANRSGAAPVPSGVPVTGGDANDPAWVEEVTSGAAVVYQCLNPPYADWPAQIPPMTASVIAGVSRSGARLVVMDNLYMYGPTGSRPISEDLPYKATGAKGKVRAQAGRDYLEAHAAGKVPVAIARASDYYGPRALLSHLGERVFYPILDGNKAQMFGDPSLLHSFSYVPDIAQGLVTIGADEDAFGQVWHLPVHETLTTAETVEKIYAAAGEESKGIGTMPGLMVTVVGLFNRNVKALQEVLYQWQEPWVIDDGKYRTAFDDAGTPLDEAIEATVEWYRANPKT